MRQKNKTVVNKSPIITQSVPSKAFPLILIVFNFYILPNSYQTLIVGEYRNEIHHLFLIKLVSRRPGFQMEEFCCLCINVPGNLARMEPWAPIVVLLCRTIQHNTGRKRGVLLGGLALKDPFSDAQMLLKAKKALTDEHTLFPQTPARWQQRRERKWRKWFFLLSLGKKKEWRPKSEC